MQRAAQPLISSAGEVGKYHYLPFTDKDAQKEEFKPLTQGHPRVLASRMVTALISSFAVGCFPLEVVFRLFFVVGALQKPKTMTGSGTELSTKMEYMHTKTGTRGEGPAMGLRGFRAKLL